LVHGKSACATVKDIAMGMKDASARHEGIIESKIHGTFRNIAYISGLTSSGNGAARNIRMLLLRSKGFRSSGSSGRKAVAA
jgi:hypothetical protein